MNFTTIANAKRQTGLSYLGSIASSSKIQKGLKYNEATYILYLSPASQSGYNVCPMSTAECRQACLNESGHNRMDVKHNRINKSRIAKTKMFFEHREFFMQWLVRELNVARTTAKNKGYSFSVRLNGTSDLNPEQFVLEGKNILQLFPDVQFYDYTKVFNRARLLEKYSNYDLTFSYSGENKLECLNILAENKGRVAIVFEGKTLPLLWNGFPVIDGDTYDMRYKDSTGVVVGLTFKQVREKIDTAKNKFIVPVSSPENFYMPA